MTAYGYHNPNHPRLISNIICRSIPSETHTVIDNWCQMGYAFFKISMTTYESVTTCVYEAWFHELQVNDDSTGWVRWDIPRDLDARR